MRMGEFPEDTLEFLRNCNFNDQNKVLKVLNQEKIFDFCDLECLMFKFGPTESSINNSIDDYFYFINQDDGKLTIDSSNKYDERAKHLASQIGKKNISYLGDNDSKYKARFKSRMNGLYVNTKSNNETTLFENYNPADDNKYFMQEISNESNTNRNTKYVKKRKLSLSDQEILPPFINSLDIEHGDKLKLFEALKSSNNIKNLNYFMTCLPNHSDFLNLSPPTNKSENYSTDTPLKSYITLIRTLISINDQYKKLQRKISASGTDKRIKRIADRVYGTIHLDRWLVENIIDTPYFQRLRDISQLGLVKYIYPSAIHSRFEHSLGVAHLSRILIENLAKKLGLSLEYGEVPRLVKAIQIAALCHDMGHGPFSHTFEAFISHMDSRGYDHEQLSISIVDQIIPSIIDQANSELDDYDLKLIRCFIKGVTPLWPLKDSLDPIDSLIRASYDIIANNRSGLDVDRMDYIRRDALNTLNFDPLPSTLRVLERTNVIDGIVAFNIQSREDIWSIYASRYNLFKKVYAHRKVRGLELMLCDSMCLANDIFKFTEAHDIEKLFELTDQSLISLLRSNLKDHELTREQRENLQKANEIVSSFTYHRKPEKIYRFISEVNLSQIEKLKIPATVENIARFSDNLNDKDIILDWYHINHGTNIDDPFDCISFYSPDDENTAYKLNPDQRALYPKKFEESQLRLYTKNNSKMDAAINAFKQFCSYNNLQDPNCIGTPPYNQMELKSEAAKRKKLYQ